MLEKLKKINIGGYLIMLFVFLLPFHAVFVTYLKCKLGIDTNLLRFWKEIVIVFLMIGVAFNIFKKHGLNLKPLYKDNYLLGTITAFILCSFVYIFFPYFVIKISNLLGFKYDVFFIFALLIGMYLNFIKINFENILKTVFASAGVILIIFLPWYLSGDIEKSSELLGYSKQVSTYEANACITFSQNVTGGHNRFQGSFGDPIRFSVFLTIFYFMFVGYFLSTNYKNPKTKYIIIGVGTILVLTSIFFSYTKTSMLGFLFGTVLFIYLVRKIIYKKTITKSFLITLGVLALLPILYLATFKRDLFLHPEAVLGRLDNFSESIDMYYYNPIGYGLGIAGPATQLGTSSDSTLSYGVVKFLPENWYIQVFLEQSLLGLGLFLGILGVMWNYLYKIAVRKKDFLSIGIFVSFVSILFMANFTHIFEEAATSYTLFMLLGAYIVNNYKKQKL